MNHSVSPAVKLMAPLAPFIDVLLPLIGFNELIPNNNLINILRSFCDANAIATELCVNGLLSNVGFDSEQLDRAVLNKMLANAPAGKVSILRAFFSESHKVYLKEAHRDR